MKILFEANSIVPNKSGGIEYFLYSLVKAWALEYPEDEIMLHIPPNTHQEYIKNVGECCFVVDPFYRFIYDVIDSKWIGRVITSRLRKFKLLRYCLTGMRKGWIKIIDKTVDVVIYPFQRELFCHEPGKVIFIMHDFRMFDMPGGDQITMANQISAITKSAFVVVSWPFPFARLNEKFPDNSDRYFKIPFLYNSMDLKIEKNSVGDFLYYPTGMAKHKNHINLIKALYLFNNCTSRKRLKIIFTGPEINELKNELIKLIAELNMGEVVSFLGFVSRETVFNLYKNCYAVITPTLYEAFSGTILEAFRFEKPVLCSHIPAHEYFCKEYDLNIAMFDPFKPDDIAKSIEQLTQNYEYYEQLSIKGKNRLNFITPEYTSKAYHDLAEKIIAHS